MHYKELGGAGSAGNYWAGRQGWRKQREGGAVGDKRDGGELESGCENPEKGGREGGAAGLQDGGLQDN